MLLKFLQQNNLIFNLMITINIRNWCNIQHNCKYTWKFYFVLVDVVKV